MSNPAPTPALAIAQAFCKLNPEFVAKEVHSTYATAERKDGAALGFYHDSYRMKINCSGNYPRDIHNKTCSAGEWRVVAWDQKGPSGSVSDTRDPSKAAKSLAKRILEPYLPLYLQCLQKLEEQKKTANEVVSRAKDILKDTEFSVSEDETVYSIVKVNMYPVGDLKVWDDGDVQLNLKQLTDDQAKRILVIATE